MSPISRFYSIIIFVVAIGFAFGLLMVHKNSSIFALLLVAWIFIGHWLLLQIKCPNCGEPLAFRGKVEGVSFYAAIARRKCRECGCALNRND